MLLADGSFLSQMMLLVGMILLAWILVRRNLAMRKKGRQANRELRSAQRIETQRVSGAPLADAPVDVLRWQSSMFDLQRELKAELETKILVIQSLLRQADQRIAQLGGNTEPSSPDLSECLPVSESQFSQISHLSRSGYSAAEIAGNLGIPQAEVELTLSAGASCPPSTELPS